MGRYTTTQLDIIARKKSVEKVLNSLPTRDRRQCHIWKMSSNGVMRDTSHGGASTLFATDIVISEFPDMPKAMEPLHLIPERFYLLGEFGMYEPYEIIVIPTNVISNLTPSELSAFDNELSTAAENGIVPLLDERQPNAPLVCVPGSFERIRGRHYSFNKADIIYNSAEPIDEEIAYSLLRHKLVRICRSAYADLVPRQKGKQKKSYKMKAVGRCCEFATLLSCGRDDFADFKKRSAHETDRARVLMNVRLSRKNFPESLHGMYDKISRLEEVTELWRAAAVNDRKGFAFNFADIDDGVAEDKMDEIAKVLGIDSFFDAWEAGVPVEDISA